MTSSFPVFLGSGPQELIKAIQDDHIIILVDVLRASSTIITALAHGASYILPVETVEEAHQRAQQLPNAFLAGERAAHPPPGFHFGNSPRSFLSNRIQGHPIIFTTSNFTRTLGSPPPTATILVGAFLNIEHVADTARHLHLLRPHPVSIIAAGSLRGPAIEDEIAADHIAHRIQHFQDPPSYASPDDIARELMVTRHGEILIRAGYKEDIEFCSHPNRYTLTPILHNGAFYPYPTTLDE